MQAAASPAISLIIPTRERAATLHYTLESALAQHSRDYEIVVSDNASADDSRQVVESRSDSRLRYVNTGQRLSMCDNYEFALQHARGRHVIFIGDDDAMIPGALDRLLEVTRKFADDEIYQWPLHIYDWPFDGQPARLAHVARQCAPFESSLREKARQVIRMGGWKYYELPSPYHCAVPRGLLSAIRDRTGRVFHSTQPDVFTAMAIPAFADHSRNVGFPVTLHGRSGQSNGMGFVTKAAQANLVTFIREYGAYAYHPTLFPGASNSANMIPDAVLRAREFFPEIYGDVEFGYEAMWAYVCRLRFASPVEILRHAREIRRHHRFRVGRYLGWSALQEGAVLRRKLLVLKDRLRGATGPAPDNILEYAQTLATPPVQNPVPA